MGKKRRQRETEEQFATEEEFFNEYRESRKDKRRSRRRAKHKFDNAVASAKNGYYDDFEEEIKKYHTENQIQVKIRELRKEMERVAKKLDFLKAADLRDKIEYLKKKIK